MIPAAPAHPWWWVVCRSARLLAALAMAWVVFAVGAGAASAADPARPVAPVGAAAPGDGGSRLAGDSSATDLVDDRAVPDERPRLHLGAGSTAAPVVPAPVPCATGPGPVDVCGPRAPPASGPPVGPLPTGR